MLDSLTWVARLLLMTSTLILFGSSLFFVYAFQAAGTEAIAAARGWTQPLLRACAAGALLATVAGLLLESIVATGNVHEGLSWSALAAVVTETQFGRVGSLRAALLVLALVLALAQPVPLSASSSPRWRRQCLCGAAALTSLVWTGHGSAQQGLAGFVHRGTDLLHLSSAAVWVGALLPLTVLAAREHRHPSWRNTPLLKAGLARFSGFAPATVALLVLSGGVNTACVLGAGTWDPAAAWSNASAWTSVFASPYVRVLLAKLALFALMLGLAAVNRYRLVPRLVELNAEPAAQRAALASLRRALLTETFLALAVLAAVAVLGTLEPPDLALPMYPPQHHG